MTAQIHTFPPPTRTLKSLPAAVAATRVRFDATLAALMVSPFQHLTVTRKELALIGTIANTADAHYCPRIAFALAAMDEAIDEMQGLIAGLRQPTPAEGNTP